MGKNNKANKPATKPEEVKEVVEEVKIEETTPEVTEEEVKAEEAVEEEAAIEETTESVTASPVYGYVSNCEKLNIRSKPDLDAEVMTVIEAGTEVAISEELSTTNFYSVTTTESEITYTGYAMKEFITVE